MSSIFFFTSCNKPVFTVCLSRPLGNKAFLTNNILPGILSFREAYCKLSCEVLIIVNSSCALGSTTCAKRSI